MQVTSNAPSSDGESIKIVLPHDGRAWVTMHGYKVEVEINLFWLQRSDLEQLRDVSQSLLDNL